MKKSDCPIGTAIIEIGTNRMAVRVKDYPGFKTRSDEMHVRYEDVEYYNDKLDGHSVDVINFRLLTKLDKVLK